MGGWTEVAEVGACQRRMLCVGTVDKCTVKAALAVRVIASEAFKTSARPWMD